MMVAQDKRVWLRTKDIWWWLWRVCGGAGAGRWWWRLAQTSVVKLLLISNIISYTTFIKVVVMTSETFSEFHKMIPQIQKQSGFNIADLLTISGFNYILFTISKLHPFWAPCTLFEIKLLRLPAFEVSEKEWYTK